MSSRRRVRRRRRQISSRFLMMLLGGALLACLFVEISRMAQISANAKYISTLCSEIERYETEQQYLNLSLSASMDPQRIYDEAVGRLNMFYPQDGQVRFISLEQYDVNGAFQYVQESQVDDNLAEMTQ